MKWDKDKQTPIEGTYTKLQISGRDILVWVKHDCLVTCSQVELWQSTQDSDTFAFLTKPGATFDDYLLEHRYWDSDESVLYELMYGASQFMPKDRKDRFLDLAGMCTVLGTILSGLSAREEMDLLSRLYFCESDEDVWDVLLDGYGQPTDFLKGYAGFFSEDDFYLIVPRTASDERLRRFVIYLASHGII